MTTLREWDEALELTRKDLSVWRPEPAPIGPDDRTPMPSVFGDDEPTVVERCPRPTCSNGGAPPHACPYEAEVNGVEMICRCCADCANTCADDV